MVLIPRTNERSEGGRVTTERPCLTCGKMMVLTKHQGKKLYCPECYVIRQREMNRQNYERKKQAKKVEEQTAIKPKSFKSIAEIQKLARESHMSYGEYVASLNAGWEITRCKNTLRGVKLGKYLTKGHIEWYTYSEMIFSTPFLKLFRCKRRCRRHLQRLAKRAVRTE